jgi:hypothetical protein
MISLLFGMQFFHFYCGTFQKKGTNCQNYDDQERSSDLRTCFLKALVEWIIATTFLHVSSYADFCAI